MNDARPRGRIAERGIRRGQQADLCFSQRCRHVARLAKAIVEGGVARNLLNTGFASSTARMVDLVRNGVQIVGLTLEESVRRCSEVPARIAGVLDRKGSLQAGKDADIVLLDDAEWRVKRTIVGGR